MCLTPQHNHYYHRIRQMSDDLPTTPKELTYRVCGVETIHTVAKGQFEPGEMLTAIVFEPGDGIAKHIKTLLTMGLIEVVGDEPAPAGDIETPAPVEPEGDLHVSPGKWHFDPDGLRSSSLEALNGMVTDIDDSVEPFETTEEAVAQLSQDFKEVK